MSTLHTIQVRKDWLEEAISEAGGMSALAEKLSCSPSTITRYAAGTSEAGPRFIASVMKEFALHFDDAFVIVNKEVRERRARQPRKAAA